MTRRPARVGAAAVFILLCLPMAAHAQKLVFLVRHAERADSGSPGMRMQDDPPLSAAGLARASQLGRVLGDAGIRAIYVTEYRRTLETAKPLAERLRLTPRRIPSRDISALVDSLKREHGSDIVFIVGHSNTVPAIIKALGGLDVTIDENDYGSLFVVVPGTETTTRIRYGP